MITNNRRITVLDALRGLAALAVVLRHYTTIYRADYGSPFSDMYDFKYGYLGVELFFMISGFVIFMTLDKVKSTKEFIVKRFVRLYPTYWICILITLIFIVYSDLAKLKVTPIDVIGNLTMIQDVLRPIISIKHIDGAYWSLMPELFFYGLMLMVFQFKFLQNIKTIGFIWILISVIGIKFDLSIFMIGIFLNFYWSSLFFAGILFYLMWKNNEEKYKIHNHLLIGCCLVVYYIINLTKFEEELKSNVIDCIVVTLFFLLFYLFIFNKLVFLEKMKVLLFLGKISYPWYLLHQNIGYIILYYLYNTLGFTSIFTISIPMVITGLLAYFVVTVFEKKVLPKLKEKLLSPKKGIVSTVLN